jgi:hypothetical protein
MVSSSLEIHNKMTVHCSKTSPHSIPSPAAATERLRVERNAGAETDKLEKHGTGIPGALGVDREAKYKRTETNDDGAKGPSGE